MNHDVSLVNHKEHNDHEGNTLFVFLVIFVVQQFVFFVVPRIVRQ